MGEMKIKKVLKLESNKTHPRKALLKEKRLFTPDCIMYLSSQHLS